MSELKSKLKWYIIFSILGFALTTYFASSDVDAIDKATGVVQALAALVQMYLAHMMWVLAKEQYDFTKSFSLLSVRSERYEIRADLQRRWQATTLQIGMTVLNVENVKAMGRLITEIRRVFGVETECLARAAYQSARQAKERAKEIEKEGLSLQKDPVYRQIIEQFQNEKLFVWQSMDTHLQIGIQDFLPHKN